MNWFRNYAFVFRTGEWLVFAIVILVSLALCIASLRLVLWFLTRKRDADEGENEYWRIHGGEDTIFLNGSSPRIGLDVETQRKGTEINITAKLSETSRKPLPE